MADLELNPEVELMEIWEDAPLEFIAIKGLSNEFTQWSKKKFTEMTGTKWTKHYERTGKGR